MSTQLEFIIQLYMMNLLQQQQQQQQQQQHLQQQQQQTFNSSPVKPKDLLEHQHLNQLHHHQQQQLHQQQPLRNLRTHKRKLSQNTNTTTSSSSRSCSPTNSNLSPLPIHNASGLSYPSPINTLQQQQQQQLLQQQQFPLNPIMLNNLPALTQLMLLQHQQQQQQQQQHQITSSNILLTPTTPNSSSSSSLQLNSFSATSTPQQTSLNLANYLGNNMSGYSSGAAGQLPPPSSTTTPASSSASASASASSSSLLFPFSAFTAQQEQQQNSFLASSQQNFLQSSTVTSTPTTSNNDKFITQSELSTVADAAAYVVEDDDDVNDVVDNNDDDDNDDGANNVKIAHTGYHDEIALCKLSSVQSSSANSKLRCSGSMALETTSECLEDSMHMPFTPEKSSGQINPSFPSLKTTQITDDDCSNVTPMTLKNAILTPPSSEQLSSKPSSAFETSSSMTPNTMNATTASNNTTSTNNTTTTTPTITGTTCTSLTSITTTTDSFLTEENLRHLRKNSSYLECENPLCRQENLREHFHCYEEPCQGKILSKKDDIIRHLKWHKKRKESLLLGFARFSSSDDCAPEYGAGCAYNWKQTHYHCVYDECPKVYVSTSDVQMHANFHRKNSEIVQEGFRRFRAHENCKIEECPFYGKKTSHYHCCREGCNHTFKNKADMEKHKVYHMKDHQLTQDGFKKILKTEKCPFDDCKYSGVSNHIHCVRESCNYILHSSTQMISHKRKHDRAEGEQNYQQFKTQRDSSEEESPNTMVALKKTRSTTTAATTSSTSTPLSSLSAEHFLARKRGRPPKKIQLPSETNDSKRIKLEISSDSNASTTPVTSQPANLAMLNPFMGNFNPASAAASSSSAVDPNAPNFQLTHLMALFQLQNPLFYQNLYPRGITAANMANILGAASAQSATQPTQLPGNNNLQTGNTSVKQEFSDKQEFKE